MIKKHVIVENFNDPYMPLHMWRVKIDELIAEYGDDIIMFTDSGKNKCQLVLQEPHD